MNHTRNKLWWQGWGAGDETSPLKIGLLSIFLCLTVTGMPQDGNDDPIINDAVRQWFNDTYQQQLHNLGQRRDKLILPGIIADRTKRQVRIMAVGTGIAGNNPVEFFLVGENGRDYESLAITIAKPSDIHRALVFIGLKPGRPIDYAKCHYWPRGERVFLSISRRVNPKAAPEKIRGEQFLFDKNTQSTMRLPGLTFVGSIWTKDKKNKRHYEADTLGDIATDYNDPWTVLDVPNRVSQGARYYTLIPNPKRLIPLRQHLTIILEPEYPPGRTRVLDCRVTVLADKPKPKAATDLRYRLVMGKEKPTQNLNFAQLLDHLQQAIGNGHDPFVSFLFSPNLPVAPIRELCTVLDVIAGKDLIRIEPIPDHPYYQAFLPKPKWRDRASRPAQPVEVHLQQINKKLNGKIVVILESFSESGRKLTVRSFPFTSESELLHLLAEKKPEDTQSLFLYSPPTLSYAVATRLYRELAKTFPAFYILPASAQASPAQASPAQASPAQASPPQAPVNK